MPARLPASAHRARDARPLGILLAALSAMGPFSINTYLPAFTEISADLGVSALEIQQTLPAYMLPFALMMFWHGPLADAYGRRRLMLTGLAIFALASMVCALAPSIEWLWFGRGLQGLVGGIGMVLTRAMVRDLFDGVEAQRMLAGIMVLFGIAPAIAPIIGGLLLWAAGWRAIFLFLTLFAVAMWLAAWRWLPETLPPEARHPIHPFEMAGAYRRVFSDHPFRRLALATSFNFIGLFLYVLAAPAFLMQHLQLSPQAFAWMFVPVVAGMMVGSLISGRSAGHWSPQRTIHFGYAGMAAAAAANLMLCAALPPGLWLIAPLVLYCAAMSLAAPSLQLLALDRFGNRRGLASSCLGVIQTLNNAIVASFVVPLLWGSPLYLAAGMAGFVLLGGLAYLLSLRTSPGVPE